MKKKILSDITALPTINYCFKHSRKDICQEVLFFSKKLRLLESKMGRPGETEEERRIRKDKERKRRREKLKEGHPDDRDSRKK